VDQEGNNVSCLNSRAIIEYIRRRNPERLCKLFEGLPSPWREMNTPEEYLTDENNWIPSGLVVSLFEKARAITGNPDVAFDIGFDSILHREFSYWQKVFFKLFYTPQTVIRRVNQLNNKLNNTKIVELIYDAPGRAIFRWHWRDGAVSSKDSCCYNKGIYGALPTLLGFPAGQVEESVCAFEGHPYCEITLTWNQAWWKLGGRFAHLLTRKSTLFSALQEIDRDKSLLRQKFDELAAANLELSQKVTMLKAINNATRAIVSISDTQKVLEQTMTPIVDVFGFDRAMIMLVDEKGENLEYRYGVGESPDAITRLQDYRIPLTRDQNLMVRVLKGRKSERVRDAKEAGLNPTNRILSDFRPSSFIVCPLIAEGKAIGVLGADRRGERKLLTADDEELLSIFANNIATAFLRARLDEEVKSSYEQVRSSYEQVRSSYESSVAALVQAIEENDAYTRGHSERVADMVVKVARVLGVPESEIEYLQFGSILHDVGKIGIRESIVRSRKPLTEAQRRSIEKHPLKGEQILKHISVIKDHMYLIRNHHERWDGGGYPDKLAGDAIPLGAQIVAIVDAYDAMTSSRPYRKRMPKEEAVQEIKKNTGTQFSWRVSEAFLFLLENGTIP
jgi:HD-GYP domain-containing protein (c-di-GMP phosphodiesterase class II)